MLREQWIRPNDLGQLMLVKLKDKTMIIKSEQKFVLISPRKVRPVVDLVKKLTPLQAIEKLPFIKKRGSEILLKVIKSAVANATERGIDNSRLIFKEIQIGEGPRLRRGMPVSRGRWHSIKKRMSHVCVILDTKSETKKVEKVLKTKKGAKNVTKN